MAKISAATVKELRDRTGLGMMDCKKALVAAEGDIEQAIEDLRKSSGMKAAKKAGRVAAEGVVATKLSDDGSFGIMVEVNSETDFAARDDNFLGFVSVVTDQVFDAKDSNVEKLLEAGLEGTREALVQKIGENISVRRAEVRTAEGGVVGSYVHGNSRIAVLVELKGGDVELAKNIAMHVAAINPAVVSPDQMDKEQVAKERDIFSAQAAESGKPPEIVEKMVEGRIRKFLAEVSLTEQPFVKDPDVKVGKLLKDAGASVVSFVRYEVGEGIEKEEIDFAEEVAAQVGASS
ncbi:MAG: elongation factor Ts [Pseudomonadales bacterium]|nr:elongation factor Ts [Pseudomonadales bacterium]